MAVKAYRLHRWLCCVWHDLFGHPTVLLHDDNCRKCGSGKAFCINCWHHYTVSY